MLFAPCLDAIPAVRSLSGRSCQRPRKLHADKGYDALVPCQPNKKATPEEVAKLLFYLVPVR